MAMRASSPSPTLAPVPAPDRIAPAVAERAMDAPAGDRSPRDPNAPRNGFRLPLVVRGKDDWMATVQARVEELHAYQDTRRSWRFYRILCQIRFGYLSFLVLMVVLMFSFTLLMEMFFAVFLPSARTYTSVYFVRAISMLVLFPFLLCLLSYVFEEACRFFSDACDKTDGGLPNFRLALAVVIHYVRHRTKIRVAHKEHAQLNGNYEHLFGRAPRRALFLTAKDDPYQDKHKEEEDAESDARDLEREQSQSSMHEAVPTPAPTSAATSEAVSAPASASASSSQHRWHKATNVVLATQLLQRTEIAGPAIDYSTFVLVDFVCPVLFEVVGTTFFFIALFKSFSPYKAFLAYVRVGFWFTMAYLGIWIVVHFWSSRNPFMRLIVSNYRRRRRGLQRELVQVQRSKQSEYLWLLDVGFRFFYHFSVLINPMGWLPCVSVGASDDANNDEELAAEARIAVELEAAAVSETDTKRAKSFNTRLQRIRSVRAKLRAMNPWYSLSYTKQGIILLVVCIAAALISLGSFMLGWPLLATALIMLSNVLQLRFPQIFGGTFKRFITWFVVLSLVFFSSTWFIGTFVTTSDFVLGAPTSATRDITLNGLTNSTGKGGVTIRHGESVEYPACSIDYNGLSVLDLALITDAAYYDTSAAQESAIRNRFNGTALEGVDYVAANKLSEHQVWMELYFASVNMTVVAVRGTASATDALEDLHFWFGITIMQAVNIFVPFLNQLPRDFVVSLLSMRMFNPVMPNPVYLPLLQHVQAVKDRVGDNLVVTGHSLGGAIAAMLGAKTHARAVSFSGPGLLYSRGRFDLTEEDIRDYVLTIKPNSDVVPEVDELGGMVQEIRCWEANPMACHSTNTHLCELETSCGDPRQRNWADNKECIRYRTLIK